MTGTIRVLCIGEEREEGVEPADVQAAIAAADPQCGVEGSIEAETGRLDSGEGALVPVALDDVDCLVVAGPLSADRLARVVDEVYATGGTPVVYVAAAEDLDAAAAFDCAVTDYVRWDDDGAAVLANRLARLGAPTETGTVADGGATVDNRFRSIVEWATDPIFLKDDRGRYRYINRAGAKLFGADVEEVLGKTDAELFDEGAAGEIRAHDERVLDGETVTYDAAREYDGEQRVFETTKRPYAPDGDVEGIIGISRDVTERRQREREAETARERVEEVLERTDDGAVGVDDDWRFTYVNSRAETLLDRDGDDLLGQRIWDAFPETAGTSFKRHLEDAMASGESDTFETYYESADLWLEVSVYPDEDGLAAYFRDVTDRKRTKAELERNEAALRDLQRLAASTGTSFEERLDRALEIGCQRLDLPVGFVTDIEADTQTVLVARGHAAELSAGETAPLSEAYCRKTIESDGVLAVKHAREDGWKGDPAYERFGLECYLGGKLVVDDEVAGTVCFADTERRNREFTDAETTFIELLVEWVSHEFERRDRERELRRYGLIVESVDDGVYELDSDGRFTFANEAMCRLTGYDEDELLGRHVSTVKGDAGRTERTLDALLAGEDDQRTIESLLVRKHGPAIDCEDHLTAIGEDGEITGVVGVLRDVTEQQAQREMLSNLVESSRDLMQARDREEVADLVSQAVRDVLGFELNVVRLYDGERLVPAGSTVDVDEVETPSFELGEGGPGTAFADGSSVVIEDTAELEDDYDRDVIRSEMHFAMGVHGTISLGATEPDAFSDVDQRAAQLLATSAAAAANRAKREEEVREARERVDALVDRINGLIENTVEVLVQSATREEVERGVCEQLAATDPYEFAWLGQPDLTEETIEMTTWEGAGAVTDAVEGHTVPNDGEDPVSLALDEERPRVYDDLASFPDESLHARARDAGMESMMVIPLAYKDARYGVLCVYASEPETFQEREQIVLSALGRAVANAINAIESGRILSTNKVIEMEFTVHDRDLLFSRLSSAIDGGVELTGSVYQSDGNLRLYFSTVDADSETVLDFLSGDDTVEHASVIAEHEGEAMFEAVVTESLIETLADHGAVTKHVAGEDGVSRYTIELPYEAEAREVFALVEDGYDRTDLVGYHEHERPVQTRQEFREAVTDRFTDRQETAIRTAYLGGFFEWPREIDGDELAEAMDISRPTYHQHLRAAQQKVFDELFDPHQRRE